MPPSSGLPRASTPTCQWGAAPRTPPRWGRRSVRQCTQSHPIRILAIRLIVILALVLGRGRCVVLLVSDVLAPRDLAPRLVVLLHGDVDHEAVRSGAVPVVL